MTPTAAVHPATQLARPQPLGVLALPAGWLLLPADVLATDQGAAARDALLAGLAPDPWPAGLEFLRLAADGDVEAAAALVDPASGPVAAYDHFVLTGEPASLAAARAGAQGDPVLAALVEVAAYCQGASDVPVDPTGLDGEVAAHALAALAAFHLEHGRAAQALAALEAGVEAARPVSPVVAAGLVGQVAALRQEASGADADVVRLYTEAVDALRGLPVVEPVMAELALGLATAYQELAARQGAAGAPLLLEAVRTYHLALRLLRRESQPERYAFAHSNLALAYLSMPMAEARDTLRRGVAVNSLREALRYYTRDEHPHEWAAVTLNLANALQHLPSTHPVENLVEAVGIYDDLLTVRDVTRDPQGRARVLANLGTALAHLGIHDRAAESLHEARALFEACGDDESLATVDAALAEVGAATAGSR